MAPALPLAAPDAFTACVDAKTGRPQRGWEVLAPLLPASNVGASRPLSWKAPTASTPASASADAETCGQGPTRAFIPASASGANGQSRGWEPTTSIAPASRDAQTPGWEVLKAAPVPTAVGDPGANSPGRHYPPKSQPHPPRQPQMCGPAAAGARLLARRQQRAAVLRGYSCAMGARRQQRQQRQQQRSSALLPTAPHRATSLRS